MAEEIQQQADVQPQSDDVVLPSDEVNDDNQQQEETIEEPKEEEQQTEETEVEKKLRQQEEYIKKLKDEKAKEKRAEAEETKEQEALRIKNDFTSEALEKALETGTFDEDTLSKAEELGIDERDLKLKMYEAKENIETLYSQAGGKEEYFSMVDAVKEVATDEEVSEFKEALSNPKFSKLAMLALKQKYSEVTGNTNSSSDNRISTTATSQSRANSSYRNENEYFSDMAKAKKLTGSDRNKMMTKIQEKLSRSSLGK